jgi:hypothetical protein
MATVREELKETVFTREAKLGELLTTSWTSDASGNYSEVVSMKGWLVRLVTDPTDGPTDNYDLTLISALTGLDELEGEGADRDTANSEQLPAFGSGVSVLCYLNGNYTVTIANGGNAKSGKIYWFLKNQ